MTSITEIKFVSIRNAAKIGPLSEYALRQMLAENRLPGIYVGQKFLINYPLLLRQLENDSLLAVRGD